MIKTSCRRWLWSSNLFDQRVNDGEGQFRHFRSFTVTHSIYTLMYSMPWCMILSLNFSLILFIINIWLSSFHYCPKCVSLFPCRAYKYHVFIYTSSSSWSYTEFQCLVFNSYGGISIIDHSIYGTKSVSFTMYINNTIELPLFSPQSIDLFYISCTIVGV